MTNRNYASWIVWSVIVSLSKKTTTFWVVIYLVFRYKNRLNYTLFWGINRQTAVYAKDDSKLDS